jgi:hypothetical protein
MVIISDHQREEETLLSQEQVASFENHGYVHVPDAIGKDLLQPVRGVIDGGVDALARSLKSEGKIQDLHEDKGFATRLALIYSGNAMGARNWDDVVFSPEFHELLVSDSLLDLIEPLLGPEIVFTGSYHLRPKLPGSSLTAFPWHQDSQYYGEATKAIRIITVWIPLVDVDEQNGCLYVIPDSHKWELYRGERDADDNMRTREDVTKRGTPIPIPMKAGDALLFTNLTFHASNVNKSDGVRWSLDVRFAPAPEDDMPPEIDAAYETMRKKYGTKAHLVRSRSGHEIASWRDWDRASD